MIKMHPALAVLGLAFALCITAACQPEEGPEAREIQSVLEEVYKAAAERDLEVVALLVTDELEGRLRRANERGYIDTFWDKYDGVAFDGATIRVEGSQARAAVVLGRNGERLEQEVLFALTDAGWRVSQMSEPADEDDVVLLKAATAVLEALRDVDNDKIIRLSTEEFRETGLRGYLDMLIDAQPDSEQVQRIREVWGTLQWEVLRAAAFEAGPDLGVVELDVERGGNSYRWYMTFRLADGQWLWDEMEQESLAPPEPVGPEAGTDCADHRFIDVGGEVALTISGESKAYYRVEIAAPGLYEIYTEGETDTIGELLDANCTLMREDDDGGEGSNFRISAELEAGVYYISVRGRVEGDEGFAMLRVAAARQETN